MFSVSITYLPDTKIIKLTTFGTLDVAADRELVQTGVAASKQYGTAKFLVDHRCVELRLRLMDVQDVPLIATKGGIPPGTSIALLHNDSPEAKQIFSFLDDVSYIQGGPRRAFTDESEAIQWLVSRP